MSTQAATRKRKAAYDARCLDAFEHIQGARAGGHKKSHDIASFLNAMGISAPTSDAWTYKAVLRAQKRLKDLGLGDGPLRPSQARSYGGPRKSRERKLTTNQSWIGNLEARARNEGVSIK